MKERKTYLGWIIALCGLWEAGDIAAVFVPGFGQIPAYVWNHILVGLLLIATGAGAALSKNARAARTLAGIAAVGGAWLVIASFILRGLIASPGLWNDVIVGGIVLILGGWGGLLVKGW